MRCLGYSPESTEQFKYQLTQPPIARKIPTHAFRPSHSQPAHTSWAQTGRRKGKNNKKRRIVHLKHKSCRSTTEKKKREKKKTIPQNIQRVSCYVICRPAPPNYRLADWLTWSTRYRFMTSAHILASWLLYIIRMPYLGPAPPSLASLYCKQSVRGPDQRGGKCFPTYLERSLPAATCNIRDIMGGRWREGGRFFISRTQQVTIPIPED